MKIDILTLFPKMFSGPFDESIVKRAQDKGLLDIQIHDLRDYGEGERRSVDDRPYGGGIGMILRVDIIDSALRKLRNKESRVVLLDAGGEKFTQKKAVELSKVEHLILIAGHYEGIDARVHEHLVDEIISIGDYVLTGGEIPAMVIADAVTRLIPGVLPKPGAIELESFSEENLLEFPQYTRPEKYRSWKVPEVLLSGNHKEIEKWRKQESLKRTKKVRSDLI
ncbi:tRNA (guanosine(37)-N1)-methyltransferase TrmD [Candidatus Woesebacteria bacterium GWC1_42_13]|uniref:tRNA (guanine-N(1)-)-methyltransferase n=1 Tax=Candidatus Woesebacteria bacterium GWC1_42_13 TaxID=1802475 RepID=A0A1F7WTW6_9BACT|nr:MAG: tRNA (guanosine(37)-N1)-methyltransferase TrmD [Candidatus Woesebacteria bacterium GWC1_42_13]